jgi:hypothetical protein
MGRLGIAASLWGRSQRILYVVRDKFKEIFQHETFETFGIFFCVVVMNNIF